ncbi:N-acetylmuramoyl-L-alanine amidase CwlD [Mechercharimyces sp. CAU 1602]|uniref:N-acetylmuramoyl-L-alanine amidase CwlD n=1 Tax=Mechercharimyces sp. CAU 1602 TaxID=2973933 RepID=UPI00216223AD|nr:N-acetylmuramoyl-L-alanine amidase CwlD [Mechercharimyces sp. CAU 1602]MCS1352597.1 N-acetylmuramoyl-L-alanine amidase CwlD [Mechercharimyces sp. CAU 1602]
MVSIFLQRVAAVPKKVWLVIGFIGLFLLSLSIWMPSDLSQTAWNMPLSGKVIVIDPGHGGVDGGAVSRSGVVEKEVTLQIATYVRDYIQEAGGLVIMTREGDYDLAEKGTKGYSRRKSQDLLRRAQMVKESRADALISIHLNSIPSRRWSGAQTFYHPQREENKKLATYIQDEIKGNLQNTSRLPKQRGNIYIIKQVQVPAVLVEVGFLSNEQEARLMADEAYQKQMATSIYQGLLRYYVEGEGENAEER